jgi:3-deoxy-manno-octulosonate cytidylyltransferase (CMP-KDO synthetase)
MTVLLVIPARYASERFPGKPLAPIRGAGGSEKTLVERTWQAAMAVPGIDRVVVATDDTRIAKAASEFGAEVVMTSGACANGTERCAEALDRLGGGYDIVVNLQGDAPLSPPWYVEALVAALSDHATAEVATPVLRCDGWSLRGFLEDRAAGRVGATTAVFDAEDEALYFSKEVIPYMTDAVAAGFADADPTPVFHHVGIYAYRPAALAAYPRWPVGALERLEGLEQLRFLEQRRPVLCVEVEPRGRHFWEVNNPEDIPRVETILADLGTA